MAATILADARSTVNQIDAPARKKGRWSAISRVFPSPSAQELGLEGALAAWFERLPWHLEAAPRKQYGLRQWMPRAQAVAMDEIVPDPEGWTTCVVVDCDHADAATRCARMGVPEPTFTIVAPATGRAHFVWCLAKWVRRDNARAMRLLERVQRALRDVLGGDRSYSGHWHHSPLSSRYATTVGPDGYSLGDLADAVTEALWAEDYVTWSTSAKCRAEVRPDYEQLGRNCGVFERVRVQAYRVVGRFRRDNDEEGFDAHVRALIEEANANFSTPLPADEIKWLQRSIRGWTWDCYGVSNGVVVRRQRYEKTRAEYLAPTVAGREKAHALRATGMSLSDIATKLGCCRSTVCNYLRAALPASAKSATYQGLHGLAGVEAAQDERDSEPSAEKKTVRILDFEMRRRRDAKRYEARGVRRDARRLVMRPFHPFPSPFPAGSGWQWSQGP